MNYSSQLTVITRQKRIMRFMSDFTRFDRNSRLWSRPNSKGLFLSKVLGEVILGLKAVICELNGRFVK